MFALKKNYFLIIESIKDIRLENIKIRNKFSIIYRNPKKIEQKTDLLSFRKKCRLKAIKFYVANDVNLAIFLNADGVYLSAFNNGLALKDSFGMNYNKLFPGSIFNPPSYSENFISSSSEG